MQVAIKPEPICGSVFRIGKLKKKRANMTTQVCVCLSQMVPRVLYSHGFICSSPGGAVWLSSSVEAWGGGSRFCLT